MREILLFIVVGIISFSCAEKSADGRRTFSDLPFERATNAKQYSDLVLQSIRTNRDKPILQEFGKDVQVDAFQLKKFVGMYSTGITGRDDWREFDVHEDSKQKDVTKGFDYAWLEPTGRLGMQIFILPKQDDSGRFIIEKLEFRSRIDVLESYGFPHGTINNYKKLDIKW